MRKLIVAAVAAASLLTGAAVANASVDHQPTFTLKKINSIGEEIPQRR